MYKRCAGALVALVIGLGAIVGLAGPASAHTGDLHGTYVCQDDGTYLATYTLTLSNVPNNKVGNFWWRIGTANFQGTPTNHNSMNYWGTKAGNGTITLGTQVLPGNTTTPPWVYAWGEWQGASNGSDGRADHLAGDCRPKDACPELSGNQPPGTVCTPPADNVEHRTLTTTPTCKDQTITTTEQDRHQGYVWDGDSFEPGPWGPWVTTSQTTTQVHPEKCYVNGHAKTRVHVVDRCSCRHDSVKMFGNSDKVRIHKERVNRTTWKFTVAGKKFTRDNGVQVQYLLPSRIGGEHGWAGLQVYKVHTTAKPCPCRVNGTCHELYPNFNPPHNCVTGDGRSLRCH